MLGMNNSALICPIRAALAFEEFKIIEGVSI